MSDNEKTWRKLSDIVDQIVSTQAEIMAAGGVVVADETDHEAFEILERIELRMAGESLPESPPPTKPDPWNDPDWQVAARESHEASLANSPPPVTGARNFWDACRKVDARNARNQRAPEPKKHAFPQSTIDATLWLAKFHPERLPGWYAKHPGLEKHAY